MKQVLLTLFASVLSLGVQAQDLIIFRDGSEIVATVQQVSETLVTCQEGKKKDLRTTQYDTKTVYMIKYERRGNVFFREDGSHTYGGGRKEDIKREVNLPKDATIIYTTDAHEIVAYEVSIGNVVTYKLENKKKAAVQTLQRSLLFMIKYPDGTKDVMLRTERMEPPAAPAQPASPADATVTAAPEAPAAEPVKPEPPVVAPPAPIYPREATIVKKDKTRIKAVIYSENEQTVSYKKKTNPNGPMYKISRSQIADIKYK